MWSNKLKEAGVNIHVIATGAGAGLQQELWSVPGSSAYLSGASFPYDQDEQAELLGFMPERFCSEEAAIDLASAAYMKAYKFSGKKPVGVGITASVASEKEHRGDHRVHCCVMTDDKVIVRKDILKKGVGSRQRLLDGKICDDFGFFSLIDALGINQDFDSAYLYSDATEKARSQFFERPFFTADGRRLKSLPNMEDYALMPGTFNPPHEGHFGMADSFRRKHGRNVVFEIGSNPPHKEPPTVQDLLKRAKLLRGRDAFFSVDMPLYLQKAQTYPGVPLLVGADTLLRMLDPKWGINPRELIQQLIHVQTTLFVGGRTVDGKFTTRNDIVNGLDPKITKGFDMRVFQELEGRWDISSTELRNKSK